MYSSVGWPRFLLALLVVAAPALLLERSDPRLASRYVWIILLGMVLFNAGGLEAYARYLVRQLETVR